MIEAKAKNELPACPVETTLTLIGDKYRNGLKARVFPAYYHGC